MNTIAILSAKGGTGKSTLSLHLAVAAEIAGKVAAVIDLDPQASAAGWMDGRANETPVVIAVPSTRLSHALAAAQTGGAEVVIIDTAPHSSDVALAAAEAADIILIPCRAGILDLRAIATTVRIAKISRKPTWAVLSAMPVRAASVLADATAALKLHGIPICPVTIHQRVAYAHSLISGQTAQEYEPGGKAAEEITELWGWAASCLAGKLHSWHHARKVI